MNFLAEYLPIVVFIAIALFIAFALIAISVFLSFRNSYHAKDAPYECGFDSFQSARSVYNIRYYLVAILFIIFDLEIAFIFPWALSLQKQNIVGFWSMIVFLTILLIGFIYEWKRGALDWE